MKIDKVINNNLIRAFDKNDKEVLVMGCGLGFKKKIGEEIDSDKIEKVYYLEDKYKDTDSTKASKFMFEKAKVECIRLKPRAEKIEISFKTQD